MSEKQIARRNSRVLALQALFYHLERPEKTLKESFGYVLTEIEERESDEFAYKILEETFENMGKIKVIIRAFAPEFAIDKIAPINRALLMLGVGEMKFVGTPPVVVINEYIEIAKDFGEDKSASFINGVLDSYRKSLGLESAKS